MPLEWTHDECRRPDCTGTTECKAFPTKQDRISMAQAAFDEYAEADGTPFLDFLQDVFLLAISLGVEPDTMRQVLEQARTEYHNEYGQERR